MLDFRLQGTGIIKWSHIGRTGCKDLKSKSFPLIMKLNLHYFVAHRVYKIKISVKQIFSATTCQFKRLKRQTSRQGWLFWLLFWWQLMSCDKLLIRSVAARRWNLPGAGEGVGVCSSAVWTTTWDKRIMAKTENVWSLDIAERVITHNCLKKTSTRRDQWRLDLRFTRSDVTSPRRWSYKKDFIMTEKNIF